MKTFHLIFTLLLYSVSGYKLPCPLEWVRYSTGDPIPAKVVESSNQREIFGRGRFQNTVRIGSVNKIRLTIRIPVSAMKFEELREFELLTNPNDCEVKFISKYDSSLITLRVKEGENYLGRDGHYLGWIFVSLFTIRYVNEHGIVRDSLFYNYLTSYSEGVSLTMKDFEYDEVPRGGSMNYIGMDEIYNKADTTITQTISHSNTVEESISLATYTSSSWSHADSVNLNVNLPMGIGASVQHEERYTEETTRKETISTSRSSQITSSRSVIVPPFTSIHVCSVTGFIENFKTDYIATGEYRVLGWTGAQVRDHLSKAHPSFEDLEVNDGYASRPIKGSFTGSVSLNTKLIITPFDAPLGCTQLEKDFEASKFRNIHSVVRHSSMSVTG